ncbi:MAG: hypothetical protein ABIJ08_03380, partial [Nanoarchaeota archaeon]
TRFKIIDADDQMHTINRVTKITLDLPIGIDLNDDVLFKVYSTIHPSGYFNKTLTLHPGLNSIVAFSIDENLQVSTTAEFRYLFYDTTGPTLDAKVLNHESTEIQNTSTVYAHFTNDITFQTTATHPIMDIKEVKVHIICNSSASSCGTYSDELTLDRLGLSDTYNKVFSDDILPGIYNATFKSLTTDDRYSEQVVWFNVTDTIGPTLELEIRTLNGITMPKNSELFAVTYNVTIRSTRLETLHDVNLNYTFEKPGPNIYIVPIKLSSEDSIVWNGTFTIPEEKGLFLNSVWITNPPSTHYDGLTVESFFNFSAKSDSGISVEQDDKYFINTLSKDIIHTLTYETPIYFNATNISAYTIPNTNVAALVWIQDPNDPAKTIEINRSRTTSYPITIPKIDFQNMPLASNPTSGATVYPQGSTSIYIPGNVISFIDNTYFLQFNNQNQSPRYDITNVIDKTFMYGVTEIQFTPGLSKEVQVTTGKVTAYSDPTPDGWFRLYINTTPGLNNFVVRARDELGIWSTPKAGIINYDNLGPVLSPKIVNQQHIEIQSLSTRHSEYSDDIIFQTTANHAMFDVSKVIVNISCYTNDRCFDYNRSFDLPLQSGTTNTYNFTLQEDIRQGIYNATFQSWTKDGRYSRSTLWFNVSDTLGPSIEIIRPSELMAQSSIINITGITEGGAEITVDVYNLDDIDNIPPPTTYNFVASTGDSSPLNIDLYTRPPSFTAPNSGSEFIRLEGHRAAELAGVRYVDFTIDNTYNRILPRLKVASVEDKDSILGDYTLVTFNQPISISLTDNTIVHVYTTEYPDGYFDKEIGLTVGTNGIQVTAIDINLNQEATGIIQVIYTGDIIKPSYKINITKSGIEVDKITFGTYDINITASEPLSYLRVNYSFTGNIGIEKQDLTLSTEDNINFKSTFTIPTDYQYQNLFNTFLIGIYGNDSSDNVNETVISKYVIDTMGPSGIEFIPALQTTVYSDTLTLTGNATADTTIYVWVYDCISMGNCGITVHNYSYNQSEPERAAEGIINRQIRAHYGSFYQQGDDQIWFDGEMLTGLFTPGKPYFLDFNPKISGTIPTPPNTIPRYEITHKLYTESNTLLEFTPGLTTDVDNNYYLSTYTTPYPEGWFNLTIKLMPGLNRLRYYGVKGGSSGTANYRYITYDNSGPTLSPKIVNQQHNEIQSSSIRHAEYSQNITFQTTAIHTISPVSSVILNISCYTNDRCLDYNQSFNLPLQQGTTNIYNFTLEEDLKPGIYNATFQSLTQDGRYSRSNLWFNVSDTIAPAIRMIFPESAAVAESIYKDKVNISGVVERGASITIHVVNETVASG